MSTTIDVADAAQQLGDLIAESDVIVPFTGAGISTETGIPDFRSPGGIWSSNQPIAYDVFVASQEARDEAWRRRFAMDEIFANAKPGRGHRALASLYRSRKILAVITQNIDGLHQASGIKADDVIEFHGNTTYACCIGCDMRYDLDWVRTRYRTENRAPSCPDCSNPV
jgi:NAD-dependent deacetylase